MAGETAIKDMTLEAVIAEAKAITPVLQRAFKEAGIALDMTKVTAFGEMDDASKGEHLSQMNVRLHELSERKCVLEQAAREVGDRRSGGDTEMTLHHDAAPSGYTYDEWRQLPLAERIRLCGPTGGAPLALPAGPGAAHEGSVDVLG